MSHKEYHRSTRVAAELRREVAVLVHEAVRDHALPSVSVSDVEVTRDMAPATRPGPDGVYPVCFTPGVSKLL